jgi:hypothetical protein
VPYACPPSATLLRVLLRDTSSQPCCTCLHTSAFPALLLPIHRQATAGQKRSKPSASFTPVTKQQPHLSAACLAALCTAINEDGLLQLPYGYEEDRPAHHQQLARNDDFRSFVLRSCCNLLEGAQGSAAASALLQPQGAGSSSSAGGGDAAAGACSGPAADEVLVLGPALFRVFKVHRGAGAGSRRCAASRTALNLLVVACLQYKRLHIAAHCRDVPAATCRLRLNYLPMLACVRHKHLL